MAENMYRALWSCLVCFAVTIIVSYMTKARPDSELNGLVYGATAIPHEGRGPVLPAAGVLGGGRRQRLRGS